MNVQISLMQTHVSNRLNCANMEKLDTVDRLGYKHLEITSLFG